MKLIGSEYHERLWDTPHILKAIDHAAEWVSALAERLDKPVSVVATGLSGVTVAYALYLTRGVPVTFVRKPDESTHGLPLEGWQIAPYYVILDDFVATGYTVRRIDDQLCENHRLLCVLAHKASIKESVQFSCGYDSEACEVRVYPLCKRPTPQEIQCVVTERRLAGE